MRLTRLSHLLNPFGGVGGVAPVTPLNLRQAVAAALLAAPAVSAVAGARVYPLEVPQGGALPALTYQVLSDVPGQHLGGSAAAARARVQVTALSQDISDCAALARAVYDLFDGFAGALPGNLLVMEAWLPDASDLYEAAVEDSDAGTYRTPIDVIIRYRQSRPANQP